MEYGRLHWFLPDELNEQQREYYDRLTAGPRDAAHLTDAEGRLYGAFNARLLDPPVGTAIQELGAALRFGTALTDREREIVILETARSEQASYEWVAHAKVARRAGLTDAELDSLRDGTPTPTLSAEENAIRDLTQALIVDRDLDDAAFAKAEHAIGPVKIFDTISLIGHYQHTALAIRVSRVPLREGATPVFGS